MQSELIAQLPEEFIIYLGRHATPDRSRSDIIYHLAPGPELTPHGLEEAHELGAFLHTAGVTHLYASPLERTWRTALIAGEVLGLHPEVCDDLAEWRPDETENTVVTRTWRPVLAAAQMSITHGPIALITHGGPIHALLKVLGVSPIVIDRCRIYDSRNLIPPAGAWRIERVDGELSMQLVFAPQGVKLPEIELAQ